MKSQLFFRKAGLVFARPSNCCGVYSYYRRQSDSSKFIDIMLTLLKVILNADKQINPHSYVLEDYITFSMVQYFDGKYFTFLILYQD